MGQVPSTQQPEAPSRPYKGTTNTMRRRWKLFLLSSNKPEPRKLTSLILLQDWQKVLVRAKLYPDEISMPISLQLYDLPLRLYPLHLACALDPPVAVVSLFVKLFPEAAAMAITVIAKSKSSRTLRHSLRALKTYKRLKGCSNPLPGLIREASWGRSKSESHLSMPEQALPRDSESTSDDVKEQDLSLLGNAASDDRRSFLPYYHQQQEMTSLSEGGDSNRFDGLEAMSSSSFASSSLPPSLKWNDSNSLLNQKGVILQLSPSGGISPFPIGSQETDSMSETLSRGTLPSAAKPLFGVQWDLTPLWESLANSTGSSDNSLLPCHVAVLYQASPAVLKLLLETHPMGAVNTVLGMLPIHMASAGWVLEPWVASPPPPPKTIANKTDQPTLQPYHCHHERHPSRIKEILLVLCQVLPQSVRIKSGNHGMTPKEYIEEAMEECPIKQDCLELLAPVGDQRDDDETHDEPKSIGPLGRLTDLASNAPSLVFADSYEHAPDIPREIRVASTRVILPEETSSVHLSSLLMARNWEVSQDLLKDEDRKHEASEWFHGCGDHLDPSIDELYPDDECFVWKRLPLHLACQFKAPPRLVHDLIQANPAAVTSADPNCGSLPLHLACAHGAAYRVIKELLELEPGTIRAVDQHGRLPLHYAATGKTDYVTMTYLIEMDYEAVLAKDKDGKTPVDYAKLAYSARHESLRLLEVVAYVAGKMKKSVVAMGGNDSNSSGGGGNGEKARFCL